MKPDIRNVIHLLVAAWKTLQIDQEGQRVSVEPVSGGTLAPVGAAGWQNERLRCWSPSSPPLPAVRWLWCRPAAPSELLSTLPASCGGSPSAVSAAQKWKLQAISVTSSSSLWLGETPKSFQRQDGSCACYLVRQLVVVPLSVIGEVLHLRQQLSFGRRRAVIGRAAGARTGPPEGGRRRRRRGREFILFRQRWNTEAKQ